MFAVYILVLYVVLLLVFSHVWLFLPMDCSPPGSCVHGISYASRLEWVTIPFSRSSHQEIKPTSPVLQLTDFLPLSHLGSPANVRCINCYIILLDKLFNFVSCDSFCFKFYFVFFFYFTCIRSHFLCWKDLWILKIRLCHVFTTAIHREELHV